MNSLSDKAVEIREVSGKQALNTFIRVPWDIYKDDPNWVPPLIAERKEAFSPKHPYFSHPNTRISNTQFGRPGSLIGMENQSDVFQHRSISYTNNSMTAKPGFSD